MTTKTDEVRFFFEETEVYLKKDFNRRIRSLIVRKLLGSISNIKILDLGAGDGTISLQFLADGAQITMLDISKNMLTVARRNTPCNYKDKVKYIQEDMERYTTDEKYDVVLCLGVLPHVCSIERTIEKISELLKKGGRCIIQITDYDTLLGRFMNRYYALSKHLRRAQKYKMNRTRGSEVVSIANHVHLRLVEKRRYIMPLPGMGILPNKLLLNLELMALDNKITSRMGGETLFLFLKEK